MVYSVALSERNEEFEDEEENDEAADFEIDSLPEDDFEFGKLFKL